ncbi:cysteine hydrolase [Alphaproteobacteria bacterium]|nr:cysteine hydrolase [Alphaproteobacteria bacterium]
MNLVKDNTVLICVDMQNAFLEKNGSMVRRGFDIRPLLSAIEPCKSLINFGRNKSIQIIYTRYVYKSDYSDAGNRVHNFASNTISTKSLAEGTWDIEIIESLKPKSEDIILDKNRPSAFINTNLLSILKKKNIKSVIICGVTTNVCVESTARDASQLDFDTFVVADATAEFEEDRYKSSLKTLSMLFAQVVTKEEVFALLD